MASALQSREVSCPLDDCDDRPRTNEEIETVMQTRKEADLKSEKALAYAFSSQVGSLSQCVCSFKFWNNMI